jgi:hypothetical protein
MEVEQLMTVGSWHVSRHRLRGNLETLSSVQSTVETLKPFLNLNYYFSAMKWLMNEHEPDLYDARMRDWYIKAAASPKEIVILLDSSGKLNHLVKDYKT